MNNQRRTKAPSPVAQAVNNLGWSMISELCKGAVPSDGTAISPLSITIALAMLTGGAEELKCKELCTKLGLDNLKNLSTALATIQTTLTSESDSGRRFTAANALFADQTSTIYPAYANHLDAFSAHIDNKFPHLVDGTNEINAWVSDKTSGLIPSLLSREILKNAHMVLINALYFKAVWQHKFDPKDTITNYTFHTTPNKTSKVDMMFFNQQEHLLHYGTGYTAVLLPYASPRQSRWSFVAYLPHNQESVTSILPTIQAGGIPHGFSRVKLARLGLPKFDLRTHDSIAPMLVELGYPVTGNFPEMGPGMNLVNQIIHSVTIVLDENGTEAAAATAVIMTRGIRKAPPSLIFDRPFLFSIISDEMQVVLFMGVFSAT